MAWLRFQRVAAAIWTAVGIACGGRMDVEPSVQSHDRASGGASSSSGVTVGGTALIETGGTSAPEGVGGTADPPPWAYCGNGELNYDEECDDGNLMGADGCSAICVLEGGFDCPDAGAPCVRRGVCGNGQLDTYESCDDGNQQEGDGCNSDCSLVSAGWICLTPGGSCTPRCAEGFVTPNGQCDVVSPFCGDGLIDPSQGEHCDPALEQSQIYGQSGCTVTCQPAHRCGDGQVDSRFGEQCEPPDTTPHQGVYCDGNCRLIRIN